MLRCIPITAAAAALLVASPANAATVESGPPASTNETSATFTFSSPAGSSFACSLDDGPFAPCASPHTVDDLSEGPHTLTVREAGALGAPVEDTHAWTVDLSPPQTSLDAHPPALGNARDADFAFSSPDASATFECSLNGAAWTGCASPRSYHDLVDGTRDFRVRARDAAGNADATPPEAEWTVDTTAPDTEILSGPESPTNDQYPHFAFGGGGSDASYWCSVDGNAFQSCGTQHNVYEAQGDGPHTLRVAAHDAAGNVDLTPASWSWTTDLVDPAKPTLRVALAGAGRSRTGPGLAGRATPSFLLGDQWRLTFGRVPDAVKYRWAWLHDTHGWSDTGDVAETTARSVRFTPPVLGGRYCLTVWAVDAAGNASTTGTETCTHLPYRPVELIDKGWEKRFDRAELHRGYLLGTPGDTLTANLSMPDIDAPETWYEGWWTPGKLALVAQTCPTCGKVRVTLRYAPNEPGAIWTKVVDLRSASVERRQVIRLRRAESLRYGRRAVEIVPISGKPRISGLVAAF